MVGVESAVSSVSGVMGVAGVLGVTGVMGVAGVTGVTVVIGVTGMLSIKEKPSSPDGCVICGVRVSKTIVGVSLVGEDLGETDLDLVEGATF